MKKPFKETRVGKFILGLGDSKLAKAVPEIASGDVLGFFKELLRKDDELTPEQREYALKLIEMDIAESAEISRRWEADMNSDSKLSKNIRPLTLVFINLLLLVLIVLDSWVYEFNVDSEWVDLLKSLSLAVFVSYFGSRGYEKTKRL